jgi:6,7-dimethyl-8-ribityllumazine synthase
VTSQGHGGGELAAPAGVRLLSGTAGEGARVAIVASRYHSAIVQRLVDGAFAHAVGRGIPAASVDAIWTAGAFELPLVAREAARSGLYEAVAALGCVIRGETNHYDYVCSETSRGIMRAELETGVPVGFGLITCDTAEQAWARAGGSAGNQGEGAMRAALEAADALRALRRA